MHSSCIGFAPNVRPVGFDTLGVSRAENEEGVGV